MKLLSVEQMKALDRAAIEAGTPGIDLMERAGRGLWSVAARAALEAPHVVVYAGPGNNGGDGFVVARLAAEAGKRVDLLCTSARARLEGDALHHFERLPDGVNVRDASTEDKLKDAERDSAGAGVVIDALLGTGLTRAIGGVVALAIEGINRRRAQGAYVVAVDVPSGLDADRGAALGPVVRADETVTFAAMKRGLVGAPGFVYAGRVEIVDIGIPAEALAQVPDEGRLLDDDVLDPLRRIDDPLAHKGSRGRALVIAGSPGKTGAGLLCARSALVSGAGLVTLLVPRESFTQVDGRVAEVMTEAYDLAATESEGQAARARVEALARDKAVIAIGPGIPTTAEMRRLLMDCLATWDAEDRALVLDADALNHLAADAGLLPRRARREPRVVLTPHPAEAARLLSRSVDAVQSDRVQAAQQIAHRFGAIAVLKGARTVIADPIGRYAICPTGNAALATAGSGDVLTGVIAARLAVAPSGFDAACEAVYWHGRAADRWVREVAPRGLTASELIAWLPRALRD